MRTLAMCDDIWHRATSSQMGTWCSGITSAPHAEGPGLNPQCVHIMLPKVIAAESMVAKQIEKASDLKRYSFFGGICLPRNNLSHIWALSNHFGACFKSRPGQR